MSRVYRAEQLALGRSVAIKILAPELAEDNQFRSRFIRESHLSASLEHPNVLPVYDAGEFEGRLYLAMRLITGTDLGKLIASRGALPVDETLNVIRQVAAALDAAHVHGLVHRDVKPANVLMVGEHVYLTDFGVAKLGSGRLDITRTGAFVGTPSYAAPEQIRNEPVDSRTDIYALGCLLYECLTGSVPFDRETEHAVMEAHLRDVPPSTGLLGASGAALDQVVATAMAKSREQRYRTGRHLAEAAGRAASAGPPLPTAEPRPTVIEQAWITAAPLASSPWTFAPPKTTVRRRPWWLWGLGALLLLLLGYGAAQGVRFPPAAVPDGPPAAIPSPTSTPSGTPTPAPATQSPTPTARQVTHRPEQLIMPSSELPQVVYTISRDRAFGLYGWTRQFETAEFFFLQFTVRVLPPGVDARSTIAGTTCDPTGFEPPYPEAREVTADVIGVGAKACLYHWEGNIVDWYQYVTGTRNVVVTVAGEPRTRDGQATAMNQMIQFARQQLAIVERVSPP